MRKELVVCLLVGVSVCLTASAQAQLFRRWGAPQGIAPQVQPPCPEQQLQQQALRQRQLPAVQQRVPQVQRAPQVQTAPQVQRVTQVQRFQAPQPQVNQNFVLVEVDQRGRILRQLTPPQQLSRSFEVQRVNDGRIAQFAQQQQQQVRPQQQVTRFVVPNTAPVVSPLVRAPSVFVPRAQPTVAVVQPLPVSRPVVTSFAPAPAPAPIFVQGVGSQFDIARQAIVTTPTLAGPIVSSSEPVLASATTEPSTVETVSLIEPATETPAGSLVTDDFVPDENVVPATGSEEVAETAEMVETADTVSILESPQNDNLILDSQEEPGLLLSGPEE